MAERESGEERDPVPTVSTRWTPLLRERHSGSTDLRGGLCKAGMVGLLAAALALTLAHQTASITPVQSSPVAASMFTSVPVPTTAPRPPSTPSVELDLPEDRREPETTPAPTAAPTAHPPRATAQPRPTRTARPTSITGTATFYCNKDATRGPLSRCTRGHPDGLYAAISPDLAFLTGKTVRVSYGASYVDVVIIDCNCRATRSIDLYADAFVRLAPLTLGRLHVTLSW